ncbi:MAG: dihydropteridine reductase [Candidatus Coproplasma sp.]
MSINEQKEYAQRLKEEYGEHSRDAVDDLRELDAKVKRPANVFAYTFGIVGSLVLGSGMCLAMGVIGGAAAYALPLGIVIGVAGIGLVVANYFIYRAILKSRKKRYAAQILSLSEGLLNKG